MASSNREEGFRSLLLRLVIAPGLVVSILEDLRSLNTSPSQQRAPSYSILLKSSSTTWEETEICRLHAKARRF